MNDVKNPSKRAYMKNAVLGAVAAVIGIKSAAAVVTNVAENHITTDNATIGGYDAVNHFAAVAPHSGHAKTTSAGTITVGAGKDFATWQAAYNSINSVIVGDVEIVGDSGTYAESLMLGGRAASGDYHITFKAATTTTNVSTTATGGTAGAVTTQSTIVETGAGWTVDAYVGQWCEITSGALNGKIRLIESNTSDTLTLIGSYFNSAPANGDTFIIRSNNVNITGDALMNPTTVEHHFENIDVNGFNGFQEKMVFTECKQTISGFLEYYLELVGVQYYRCFFDVQDGIAGLWSVTSTPTFFSCFILGANTTFEWGILAQGGGQVLYRCGTVIKNLVRGVWGELGGIVKFNWEPGGDPQSDNNTVNYVKNNTTGVFAESGGHVSADVAGVQVAYSGNTTDTTADAASFSWIG